LLSDTPRNQILSTIMGGCSRIGHPWVMNHIRARYGGTGYARDLNDIQLVETLLWTHDRLPPTRVSTIQELKDQAKICA
jgi:hypothetical protein